MRALMAGAGRLLDARARRGAVRRARAVGAAPRHPHRRRAAHAARRVRADRLLGVADRDRAAGRSLAAYAETARNLVWVGVLYSLPVGQRATSARQRGVRLVYGAVAGVLGLQLVVDALAVAGRRRFDGERRSRSTAIILRITAAAGALVLVHNLYGQAAPASRASIRFAMLALAMIWVYDLNLYTVAYLDPASALGPVRLARAGGRADRAPVRLGRAARAKAGASACRARRPSSRCRCSPSAAISR